LCFVFGLFFVRLTERRLPVSSSSLLLLFFYSSPLLFL